MSFYSIGYREVLSLPIPVFWELSRNIDRIKAEDDMRMMRVINSAFGGADKVFDQLKQERGEVASSEDLETGFDKRGLNKLKAILSKGKMK